MCDVTTMQYGGLTFQNDVLNWLSSAPLCVDDLLIPYIMGNIDFSGVCSQLFSLRYKF